MNEFSELIMSNAFNFAINESTIKGIPVFGIVFKEVVCQQGIADFVGLTSDGLMEKVSYPELVSIESCSQVLSLLKLRAGRSKCYLKERSGFSQATLNRIIRELIDKSFVVQKDDLYFLSNNTISAKTNIWAFELKLSNWKRAIFQALQYKAFANYSVVVFPYEKEKLLKQNIDSFRELNIGVLIFDTDTQKAKWLLRPKKERPISKWHALFLLRKLTNQFSCDHLESSET